MQIALISDIHSNIEALTTALKVIDERDIESIVCLGDIVGYGADPDKCIEIVRSRASVVTLGNHDAAVVDKADLKYFNEYAKTAALWTRTILSHDHKEYLKSLPLTTSEGDLHFVHGTPHNPEHWDYIFSAFQAMRKFDAVECEVCFVGHSHIPGDYRENPVKEGTGKRIINVGSVGQPRDRDPRLCFAIFDTDTRDLEFIRAEYDIETAAQKILKSGLPGVLAERLKWGW